MMNYKICAVICAVCDKPITGDDLENRYWWHESDCPNYHLDLIFGNFDCEPVLCNCHIETHEGCIPDWAKEYWEEM